jgi:hypothetical protein
VAGGGNGCELKYGSPMMVATCPAEYRPLHAFSLHTIEVSIIQDLSLFGTRKIFSTKSVHYKINFTVAAYLRSIKLKTILQRKENL